MTAPAVRLATAADAEQIAGLYAPIVRETTISFELEPPTAAEMARRIGAVLAADRPWLVLDRAGDLLGYAYGGRYRERAAYQWSVESSICVAPAARRAGVARALYGALLSLLTIQGFRSVFGAIALPNEGSVALHRSLGFEPVGVFRDAGYKHGAWRDVEWWQRRLATSAAAPASPRALAEAQRDPGWAEAVGRAVRAVRA